MSSMWYFERWIANFHEHETLLQENEEEKLSKEEQDMAWEVYRKTLEWEEVQRVPLGESLPVQKPQEPNAASPVSKTRGLSPRLRNSFVTRKCTNLSHLLTLRSQGTKFGCSTVCGECAQEIRWEDLNRDARAARWRILIILLSYILLTNTSASFCCCKWLVPRGQYIVIFTIVIYKWIGLRVQNLFEEIVFFTLMFSGTIFQLLAWLKGQPIHGWIMPNVNETLLYIVWFDFSSLFMLWAGLGFIIFILLHINRTIEHTQVFFS